MWKFWIDTGGTFTDCLAADYRGRRRRIKVLSSSCLRGLATGPAADGRITLAGLPELPHDFFKGYGLRHLGGRAEQADVVASDGKAGSMTTGAPMPSITEGSLCELVSPEEPPIFAVRMITGALLDEPLPPLEMRLATTRGTNALLERKGAKVAFWVTKGFGDLLRIGNQQRPKLFELGIDRPEALHASAHEVDERLDAAGRTLTELDLEAARRAAAEAVDAGIEAFAIAFLHSYRNPEHERRAAAVLREAGARYVSVSSELSPLVRILPRAETTVVDAYLAPIMDAYLDAAQRAIGGKSRLRIMTSAGGLASRAAYRAKDSLLSGPAGGVVGSAAIAIQAGCGRAIAFDMGGTSTDVSRFDGQLDYRFEQRIGAARVFAPSLRIETVAAGGGSLCWFDGTALRVGPESAGARPGPACYGAGGPLALTDVNLLLGRLDASRFGIPVYPDAARRRLRELQEAVASDTGQHLEEGELLQGFVDIANERMAEAIRKISVGEGFKPADYPLVAFGGAGGLHACAVAAILQMDTVLFPADAGLLSAYGLSAASVEQFAERQILQLLGDCLASVDGWAAELAEEARQGLVNDGVDEGEVEMAPVRYELRFRGQESILTIEGGDAASLAERFESSYASQFGFLPEGLPVELVTLRAVARSRREGIEEERFEVADKRAGDGRCLGRESLVPGTEVVGPAVIQDPFSTVYVEQGWTATVGSRGSLRLLRRTVARQAGGGGEVIELELFTNRFLSIVEEMGALLERTAFSTNVRDRKDFSCALLDADGWLVANAPHIPVHLGALGVCLRRVLETLDLDQGDVVVTNHPAFGGSHLPDVTLLAPVYSVNGATLLGFVANRAHHAELGGKSPGSMPPDARNLTEEGVVIPPMKVAAGGRVDWQPLLRLLRESRYPSRSVNENLADMTAQLAAIRRGSAALQALAKREGSERTRRFMALLKRRAATALERALNERFSAPMEAVERLDNGAEVRVRASRTSNGRWRLDFAGSAPVQASNYNATPAIVTSAAIYVLRLLADEPIPLNEGFLDVVELVIPPGMLNPPFHEDPSQCPPVVAGNVEVSQLIVSTLLKAFGLAACSQSTMNNLIFGTDRFGYYETIAGGEGATARRPGASGVHTHMTNTAMTDPEILELRYPARVERFALRQGSGGPGRFQGGDGLIKRMRFLEKVTVSLLTQRRERAPFGMEGGCGGALGEQALIRPDGSFQRLPSNGAVEVEPGCAIEIRTPGGGGWGSLGQTGQAGPD